MTFILSILFLALAFLFFSWGLAFIRIFWNPDWYYTGRALAGHDIPSSTIGVLTIKVIQMIAVGWGVVTVGNRLGYW